MILLNIEGFNVNIKDFSIENSNVSTEDFLRFLKGKYQNSERLKKNLISLYSESKRVTEYLSKKLVEEFGKVEPFSYLEAFKIKNNEFRIKVFGTIDISDMIHNMGCKRIKVAGMPVKRKQYDDEGNFTGYKEYDNIYETYRVKGDKLNLNNDVYAIKVWCTSTNQEHWIWINEMYKDDPLAAIASTFRIHENLIPYVKELKRQGDVMLVELTEEVEPEGEKVALTKDQYFGWLTAES